MGCQEFVLRLTLSECPLAVSLSESSSVLKAVGAYCIVFPVGYCRLFSKRNLNLKDQLSTFQAVLCQELMLDF